MIIVGVDGSASARAAVEWAAGDASRMRLPLRIVHAVDRSPDQISKYPGKRDALLSEGNRILHEAEALAYERQPTVQVTLQQVEGTPAAVLQKQAEEATMRDETAGRCSSHATSGGITTTRGYGLLS